MTTEIVEAAGGIRAGTIEPSFAEQGFDTGLRRIQDFAFGTTSPLSSSDADRTRRTLTDMSQFVDGLHQLAHQVAIAERITEVRSVADAARLCVERLKVTETEGIRGNFAAVTILRFLMASQRLEDGEFTRKVAGLTAAFGERYWQSEFVTYGKTMTEDGDRRPFIRQILESAIAVGRENNFNAEDIADAENALSKFK